MSKLYFKVLFQAKPRYTGEMAGEGGGAGAGTVSAPSTPASTPSTPSSTPSTPSSTPSQSAPTQSAPAQQQAPSLRDFASRIGFDTSRYADDATAERALQEQVRQLQGSQHFAQIGQQIYPQLSEFQKWQKSQQAAAEAAQAQQSKWWNPPEWNPDWLNQVDRDPNTGALVPKMGFAPDIIQKIEAYKQHRESMLNGMAKDPIEFLKPGLEPLVREMAQKMIQESLGGFQANNQIQQLVSQAKSWMVEQDPVTGASKMTLPGQIMQQHVAQVEQMGVRDPRQVYDLAFKMTRGTLLEMQQNAQAAAPQQTPAAPAQPAQPAGVNRLQQLGSTGQENSTGIPRRNKKSLGDQMMAALDAKGISSLS
jgi:hypothetical protein